MIQSGEIGIVILGLKNVTDIAVGDTMTDFKERTKEPVAGFEPANLLCLQGFIRLIQTSLRICATH